MTTLVLGATGATGRLAVSQLLKAGEAVRVLVRSAERFHKIQPANKNLAVIETEITELSVSEWQTHLVGINSVVSCLGHSISIKGLFGHPRRFVTDTVSRIHQASQELQPESPIKYILMNTTGAINPDLNEKHTLGEAAVVGLLRKILPPHADNEGAANYLRTRVGNNDRYLNWVIVRPDTLIDSTEVTSYTEEPSPVRSPIFNAGQTSRVNVGNFMSRLIVENQTWQQWQGKTPVLYNLENGS